MTGPYPRKNRLDMLTVKEGKAEPEGCWRLCGDGVTSPSLTDASCTHTPEKEEHLKCDPWIGCSGDGKLI